ncbi:unnamed protein product [Schistosoma curassoni]|nr:unnamed protein product [Schistosoma curassoni]
MNYTNYNNLFDKSYAEEINEFPFTISQVGCICEVLIRSNQIITLRHLLNRIPKIWLIPEEHFTFYYYQQLNKQSNSLTIDNLFESREIIIKALAIVSYEDQNYKLVYQLLQCNHFNERHQAILQQLWYKTHYAEVQNSRDRPLTAVDKYRIRKKYPLPKTIWDGVQTVYCFKQNVRHILIQYYQQNKYPNSREKYEISIKTGLTFTQVSNWFKNHRQRDKSLESTDLYFQHENKTLLNNNNNNYNCNWSWQSIQSNININNSIKQHEQSIKNELSIETYRKCYNYQSPFQPFTNQQKLPDNNGINKNLSSSSSSSSENLKDSECHRTTISCPTFSHQYVSSKHSNEIWFTQLATDHSNVEQDKHNYEVNYYTTSFDYNQNNSYYTL